MFFRVTLLLFLPFVLLLVAARPSLLPTSDTFLTPNNLNNDNSLPHPPVCTDIELADAPMDLLG